MDRAAVFHRSNGSFCYAADRDTVVIRLQTGKDVDEAFILCSDPFINELERKSRWYGKPYPMSFLAETECHYLWEYRIKPPFKRLQYYFEIRSAGQSYYVFDNKVCTIADAEASVCQYFKFPWLNPSDILSPPEYVSDIVWYQIMPDRFGRNAGAPDDPKLVPWNQHKKTGFNHLYGGNLKGITERLPYLHELGIRGLYLTPVFLSNSYHKYNTFDYKTIDPDFGTEDDMRELVQKAHELGIRIMLDGVFNHCGTEFFAWKDVCEKRELSPYYEWFFINDKDFLRDRFDTADGRFYTFSFWAGMPKLNTNNPEVIRYFTDICSYWVREWDIDGIRFDVGDEVSHTFLQALSASLKALKSDIFLLGEIWFDSIRWLCAGEYDSVMNYPLSSCINDFSRHPQLTAKEFMYSLNRCLNMYPEQSVRVMFNFLDTHDTTRIAEECKGNQRLLLQKLALLMTMPGTPCLYYGTEIALRGRNAAENRRPMPWDELEKGMHDDMLHRVRELIRLRHSLPELKTTCFRFIFDDKQPRLLHYQRFAHDSSRTIGIILNGTNTPLPLSLQGNRLFSEGFDGKVLLPEGTIIYETDSIQ